MEEDKNKIAALVETYRAGFATLDANRLQSIWDRDHEIIYCPMELATPLRGWPEIEQYYLKVTKHFKAVRLMETGNLTIEILGDTAFAFFTFRFEGEVEGRSDLHKVEGRNTLIFRRRDNGWKGIHYHESRIGSY